VVEEGAEGGGGGDSACASATSTTGGERADKAARGDGDSHKKSFVSKKSPEDLKNFYSHNPAQQHVDKIFPHADGKQIHCRLCASTFVRKRHNLVTLRMS